MPVTTLDSLLQLPTTQTMMDRLVTPCGTLPCMLCVLTNETKEGETALMFVLFQHRMASVTKGGGSLPHCLFLGRSAVIAFGLVPQ